MPFRRIIRAAFAGLAAAALGLAQQSAKDSPKPAGLPDIERAVKTFVEALVMVSGEASDPVAMDPAFYQGAIPGMLRPLDPHSVFFDVGQFEQLKQMERSEQKGFGSIVSVLPGRVIFLQTLPGTPSARAGLAPGDEILAIGNIALARLEFDQIVQLLGEARKQQITLTVRRPGSVRPLAFTLTPELMDAPSVDRHFPVAPGVGYLRVASFDPNTAKQAKEAIEQQGGAALKGLVVDLRNNPGGVAAAAVEMAAMFLKPGQRVLSIRGRNGKDEDVDVPQKNEPYAFPVAVLINEKSASASEIFAGAMQDHDRAAILGEPSFGKGLVQTVYPLSQGAGLALTTAFYYTPSGRSIQKPLRGPGQLGPATVIERKEYKTDSGRVVRGGGGIEPDETVHAEQPARLGLVIEASASFLNFATEYISRNKVDAGFEVTPEVLDEFRVFLSARSIQPSVAEFLQIRDWLQSRLQQEILTQGVGVAKGDEIEARRDPVIRKALERLAAAR